MTADEVRQAMGSEFSALADELRERFGAKLVFLKTAQVTLGKDPSADAVLANGQRDEVSERLAFWYRSRRA